MKVFHLVSMQDSGQGHVGFNISNVVSTELAKCNTAGEKKGHDKTEHF